MSTGKATGFSVGLEPTCQRLSAQECRPPRQPPYARVPRSSPVAAETEPCVSSFRLRDAMSSWQFENQIGDVPQLHQVCQTCARNGPVGNRLGVRHHGSYDRQNLADLGNRRDGRKTTYGGFAGQKVHCVM